jgi:uncharacterized YigZ family protein
MEVYAFKTVSRAGQGLYKEKGSKFISFAFPVRDEADVRTNLEQVRKEYFDARHHCYAWVLGPEKKHFRSFDDGEPNHSAGDPILGQIRSRNLANVLVIVVRYFGGTKLGVSGLIHAYRTAAAEALDNAGIHEESVTLDVVLEYEYDATPEVMRLVKEFQLSVLEESFSDSGHMRVRVLLQNYTPLVARIDLLRATGTAVNLLAIPAS